MRKGGKTQPCGKRAPGRELQFKGELQNGAGAASRLGGEEGWSGGNTTSQFLVQAVAVELKGCGLKGCFTR